MKKLVATGLVAVCIAGVAVVLWLRSGPDASQFAEIANPRIAHMERQHVLVVEAIGDPNEVAGGAFEQLFAAYYKTPGVSRWQGPPAPRARWPRPAAGGPPADWAGRYALPISGDVTTPPPVAVAAGAERRVALDTWEYGDVAEVLHVGRYSDEAADIARLEAFIAASGRVILGEHEEEYVRGPGMIFAGDPGKYLTIIRLRLAPAGGPGADVGADGVPSGAKR